MSKITDILWEEFWRTPVDRERQMNREIVELHGAHIDEGIRTGSSVAFLDRLAFGMPPDVQERVVSMLAYLVRILQQQNMTARADWVRQVWIEQSNLLDQRRSRESWEKFKMRWHPALDRPLKFEMPPRDDAAVVRHYMKLKRIEPSAHTEAVLASKLSVRQTFTALTHPDLFQSMLNQISSDETPLAGEAPPHARQEQPG